VSPIKAGIVLSLDGDVGADARMVESLGFDYLAAGEHVFFPTRTTNAFITLAAAASVTRRVRLLSCVTLLPLYPAALAAKLAATLDRVSGGRFELGVGVGGEFKEEFEACGIDVRERGRRADDALTVLRPLLSGECVFHEGPFGRLPGLALDPPPVQDSIRVWVGGRRESAQRRAARFGDVWIPYMCTPEMLAEGVERIRREEAASGRHGQVEGALFAWLDVDGDRELAWRSVTDAASAAYGQDFSRLASRYLIAGSPAEVRRRLSEYREAGATTVILCLAAPSERRRRALCTLAEDVLPEIR
jgi:probable F420-dependent oxidoreductase